jgi:DNA helicase II / ATP-dependent DNA helicase PcrA
VTTSKIELNKEQLAAVKHKSGPLMIIAGAGTGKTTVITERIKYLIEKNLANPSEILTLTFTEKAAREMEERVDLAMPYGYTQMWISTFHSFCDRVLRAEALQIGLDPRFRLMTQAETMQLVRNNIFKFKLNYFMPLGNPTKFVGGMLQHFSRLQDEDVNPAQNLRWIQIQKSKIKNKNDKLESIIDKTELEKWEELAGAYKTYEELKIKEGKFDYGDLIVKTLELFRKRPNILKSYQKQFKYILVDEYQDTNIAQNELVKLLSGKEGNTTVVLDDDQSIYRFRGAAVSNAIQFRKTFPKTKIVTLIKNYRSSQEILNKAYDLIQNNNPDRLEVVEKIDKKLVSVTSNKGKEKRKDEIKFIHSDRVENEAEEVAKEISRIKDQGSKIRYKDMAILVRANNHAESFTRALARHGIPFQFLGPGRLFKQPEIIDLISYLKVLYNFEDDVSLNRLLSMEQFGIDAVDIARINNFARKNNFSVFDATAKLKRLDLKKNSKKQIRNLRKIIKKHLKLVRKESAGQILYYFLESTDLIDKLLNPETIDAEKRAKNIGKFFDKLKTYEVDHEDASVFAIVDWIDLSMDLGESPLAADTDWTEINAVNILTVHSSKGLEFPVVFLVNLVSQRFPTIERREQIPIPDELIKEVVPSGDAHTQEERRLFYVGMTRAKEKLYLTAADYYGEGKREKKLSPFIFEALGDEAMRSELSFAKASDDKQLSFESFKIADHGPQITDHRQKIHIDYLSYSQISIFEICPLHYKLQYILKVPTAPSAALSFGSSIHNTMKDLYESVMGGKKSSGSETLKGRRPTVNFAHKLLTDNWQSIGYKSKAHEKKMFERGKIYLSDYLKKEFDPKVKTVLLEQPFVIPLHFVQDEPAERPLKIGGRMDRIDKIPEGIEIIDYKTSESVPDQKKVDRDLQLTFYALAANGIDEPPFNEAKKVKLSLYYFKEQKKITTERSSEQLKEAEKEIFEWRKKIEESDFKCSHSFICQQGCEYSLMCNVD